MKAKLFSMYIKIETENQLEMALAYFECQLKIPSASKVTQSLSALRKGGHVYVTYHANRPAVELSLRLDEDVDYPLLTEATFEDLWEDFKFNPKEGEFYFIPRLPWIVMSSFELENEPEDEDEDEEDDQPHYESKLDIWKIPPFLRMRQGNLPMTDTLCKKLGVKCRTEEEAIELTKKMVACLEV